MGRETLGVGRKVGRRDERADSYSTPFYTVQGPFPVSPEIRRSVRRSNILEVIHSLLGCL